MHSLAAKVMTVLAKGKEFVVFVDIPEKLFSATLGMDNNFVFSTGLVYFQLRGFSHYATQAERPLPKTPLER